MCNVHNGGVFDKAEKQGESQASGVDHPNSETTERSVAKAKAEPRLWLFRALPYSVFFRISSNTTLFG